MNEQAIFEATLAITDPIQRQAFLQRICAGDQALRSRIESLLAAHEAAPSAFLNQPAVEQLRSTPSPAQPPTIELSAIARPSPSSPDQDGPEHDAPVLAKRNSRGDEADGQEEDQGGETDLSYLEPSTRPGSLGRLGHYELLEILGKGGFGVVFKAFDEKLHRLVAVKALSPQLATTSPPRKRFLREARAVAAIKHENIIQIYSVEEHPLPYLAMEFVDGLTLKDRMDTSGPLDLREILHLGRQMAAGLAAAHDKGLIHRDIKPGNILVEAGSEQRVKITDFGLARAADDATMTRTGTISGTPMFMAPEQALGQPLDHRADLFSLGSVLYQMTCGRTPFRGPTTISVLKRVIDESPRPLDDILPEVPGWLCAIIEKLHEKNPDDRYQSARDVAEVLARCQHELQANGAVTSAPPRRPRTANKGVVPSEQGRTQPATSLARRSPVAAPVAALVAVAVLILGGLTLTELSGITHLWLTPATVSQPAPAGVSLTSPPLNSPPLTSAPLDSDRSAAEWLLGMKTPFGIRDDAGVEIDIRPPADLPRTPFRVFYVHLPPIAESVTDDDVAKLRGLASLESVDLSFCRRITDGGVAHLADCPALSTLFLTFAPVSDQCVSSLSKLSNLRDLGLAETALTDEGILQLVREHPRLNRFIAPPSLTVRGLAALAKLPELKELGIRAHLLTPNHLPDLQRFMGVTTWSISGLQDEQVTSLSQLTQIERLYLAASQVSPQGVEELARLPNLVSLSLDLSNGVSPGHLQAVSHAQKLQDLFLRGSTATDEVLAKLRGPSSLRTVVLTGSKVSEQGVKDLQAALPQCRIEWDGGVLEPTTIPPSSAPSGNDRP